jgi:DNA-binding Lrp family transcriptional regulator
MSRKRWATPQDRQAARDAMVMKNHNLDGIDLKILTALQEDARMTNVDVSERAGVSPPPCLRRMRSLENKGFIRGYHARLDPKMLGFEVSGFVSVRLATQNREEIDAFERKIQGWPQVRECHALSGDTDFLLKCVARDLPSFQHFVTETLMRERNVERVKTSLVVRPTAEKPGLPLQERGTSRDGEP